MTETLLLSVREADLAFNGVPLFEGLTFNITAGEKICLVGKNGAGKTTLMNIITGKQSLDYGERWTLPGISIGYLQQNVTPRPGQTVFEFVFDQVETPENMSDEAAEAMNAYKVDIVLAPLELSPEERMDRLSGGQVRRAALARALVEDPDILLMDEPTNHLDLEIIEWLEGYLKRWSGALVVISHDKAFLANISEKVFWLDRGNLRVCPYGFGRFEAWQEKMLEQEARELHNREKLLAEEIEWASRGVKARRKRNVRRLEEMQKERAALKRDKSAYRKMMATIDLPKTELVELSSKVVAEFKSVCKSYEKDGREVTILDKFDLRIMRGDRIGILGTNGSGKTTFLKLLTGEVEPDSGTIKIKKDLDFSYFDQRRRNLDPEKTLWETMCPGGGDYVDVRGKGRHVIGYLKDFLFDPDTVRKKVKILSGGQQNRLMLARVLAHPKSLLILDEPTNDLDMETLDMLEDILAQYDGTLLVVSHDRDFLDQTVSKILAFEGDGKVEGYIGGYSDYLKKKKQAKSTGRNKTKTYVSGQGSSKREKSEKPSGKAQTPQKLTYKHKYELEQLPDKIDKLTREVKKLENTLSDPDLYQEDPVMFQRKTKRLALAREELEEAEDRWLELEEKRRAAEG